LCLPRKPRSHAPHQEGIRTRNSPSTCTSLRLVGPQLRSAKPCSLFV